MHSLMWALCSWDANLTPIPTPPPIPEGDIKTKAVSRENEGGLLLNTDCLNQSDRGGRGLGVSGHSLFLIAARAILARLKGEIQCFLVQRLAEAKGARGEVKSGKGEWENSSQSGM